VCLSSETAASGFWSLFGTVWAGVFTKNGGYLACLRDSIICPGRNYSTLELSPTDLSSFGTEKGDPENALSEWPQTQAGNSRDGCSGTQD